MLKTIAKIFGIGQKKYTGLLSKQQTDKFKFAKPILIKVLFSANDMMTRIIVIPFLVFAVAIGMTNVLVVIGKKALAVKMSKVYVVAFLIYWFGFLIYWDYTSFLDGNYMKILYSVPFWLGGIYFTYKRFFKRK